MDLVIGASYWTNLQQKWWYKLFNTDSDFLHNVVSQIHFVKATVTLLVHFTIMLVDVVRLHFQHWFYYLSAGICRNTRPFHRNAGWLGYFQYQFYYLSILPCDLLEFLVFSIKLTIENGEVWFIYIFTLRRATELALYKAKLCLSVCGWWVKVC